MSSLYNTLSSRDEFITTPDEHPVKLTLLISSLTDLEEVAADPGHAHGTGLLDTNFLYRNREELPGEEEQYRVFCRAAAAMPGKPVTVRTCSLHAGMLPEIENPHWVNNPDLGLKGLRLGLQQPEILKCQLRAILRANTGGQLRILLPTVSTPREINDFKNILAEAEQELHHRGASFHPITEFGLMADIPSAVINAAQFSFLVSFFQAGSELRNYTLGADFTEEGLNYLQHDFDPAFLHQVLYLAQTATRRNKTVGVSAPLASLPEAAPILLAIGVQEFITRPGCLQEVKKVIENLTVAKARVIASKAISYWSGAEVQEYTRQQVKKYLK